MKNIFITLWVAVLFSATLTAQQFDLSAEVRPRFENKYGYQTLRYIGQDAASFISQRTRLNFDFKNDDVKLKVSVQNIRVWGDVSTLANDDKAMAFHEAWGEVNLAKGISLKLGRQEIAYDDHRIFGNVGWAQQARSHDAFLFKLKPNDKHKVDIGLAYNADNQGANDTLYSNAAGYKAFQYAWYHGDFDKLGLSFLVLNTGKAFLENKGTSTEKEGIAYMQTIGPRLTFKSGKFSANGAAYYQMGTSGGNDVNAYFVGADLAYQVHKMFKLGAGMELLSGKDMNDQDGTVRSFAPLFGTNHKFNGWMDYFYVGNHAGSVGLTDLFGSIGFKKDKFSARIIPHIFLSDGAVYDGSEKLDDNLGTEIDLDFTYKLNKNVSVKGGYSQLYATKTMEALKGGNSDISNSWGWLMVIIKPKLFSVSAGK